MFLELSAEKSPAAGVIGMTGTSRIVHVMVTSLATVQLPGMLHKHRRSGRQHYTASSLLQLSWDVAQLAELPLICTHSHFQGRLSQDNLLNVLTLLHSPTLDNRPFHKCIIQTRSEHATK